MDSRNNMSYRRIEIALKPDIEDPSSVHTAWEISTTLDLSVQAVWVVSVYTVYSELSDKRLVDFAREVLSDPVITNFSVGSPIALTTPSFRWAVEVSFKQGVTDNVGHTAAQVLSMMTGGEGCSVYRSTQYLIDADITLDEIKRIASEVLYNDLIEEIDILSYDEFIRSGGFSVKERHYLKGYVPETRSYDLHIPDEGLNELSKEKVLALSVRELEHFRSYFDTEKVKKNRELVGIGYNPTDVELVWQLGFRDFWWKRGVVHTSAMSGIDQALWDIAGKAAGVPAFKLLGGKVRDRIRCYARPDFAARASWALWLIWRSASSSSSTNTVTAEPLPICGNALIASMRMFFGPFFARAIKVGSAVASPRLPSVQMTRI